MLELLALAVYFHQIEGKSYRAIFLAETLLFGFSLFSMQNWHTTTGFLNSFEHFFSDRGIHEAAHPQRGGLQRSGQVGPLRIYEEGAVLRIRSLFDPGSRIRDPE
jgi:hypothetical protein